jgi:hypothetical protein
VIAISLVASGLEQAAMPRCGRDKGQELIDLDSDTEDGEAFRHPVPPKSPLSLCCAAPDVSGHVL